MARVWRFGSSPWQRGSILYESSDIILSGLKKLCMQCINNICKTRDSKMCWTKIPLGGIKGARSRVTLITLQLSPSSCTSLFLTVGLNPKAQEKIYRVSWSHLSPRQLPSCHHWVQDQHRDYLQDLSVRGWGWFALPLIISVKWIFFAIKADYQRRWSRCIDLIVSSEN